MSNNSLSIDDSSVRSRLSSTRRSKRGDPVTELVALPPVKKRQPRTSLANPVTLNNRNDSTFPELCTLTTPVPAIKGKRAIISDSQSATSSIFTINDSEEFSGYSTPATSAMMTPNTTTINEEPDLEFARRRPGRPRKTQSHTMSSSTSKAFEKARKLRNSKLSLNTASNKRKRAVMSEDEADDVEDTADAQLARALQLQEDTKANIMVSEDSEVDEPFLRRTQRALRAIKPLSSFVSDYSDDDTPTKVEPNEDVKLHSRRFKRTKLEIKDSEDSGFLTSEIDTNSVVDESNSALDIGNALSDSAKARIKSQLEVIVNGSSSNNNAREIRKSAVNRPFLERQQSVDSSGLSVLSESAHDIMLALDSEEEGLYLTEEAEDTDGLENADSVVNASSSRTPTSRRRTRIRGEDRQTRRARQDRARLETHHPELFTMWEDLKNLPAIKTVKAEQPTRINRELKPFQLEGLSWMRAMEETEWGGGLLGDEMGMGKTIQAVSLIMSDYPAKNPSLVLIPPVALMQWQQEIGDYTDGTLKTFVYHGTNAKTKEITLKELNKFDVILMSYNSLESMYRHQEKGRQRKFGEVSKMHFQKSPIHQIQFHRVILDEAHNIKQRTTGVAKACFALKADHKWCLSGTPLQNRIGEFFSLVRFLDIRPFACYFCKQCPCSTMEWSMDSNNRCTGCKHSGMQHVSVFNQELLNPIQKFGNKGPGKIAFEKLRLLTDRFMLRRVKRDHSSAMELPSKEIVVDRQFFGEQENDFSGSIMNNSKRKFETYVAQGVMLNNYANIFGLIMQMRQVADHPDLILKKHSEGGQNVLNCCICDETAEDAIRSSCKHDFCRQCVKTYIQSVEERCDVVSCPRCHIALGIDLEQPEMEQNETDVKKSSIINRINMANWTSSSKIEALVHDLHSLRSNKSSSKSIIFSQFTTMLQLVEWRLRRAGITTVMLDGSMTPAQRQASINTFMTDVNVECFLVSLKAGGVALNLTEASKVFIIDPWWNPAAEWQSADRCHRIGQSRPCTITRLCIEDSVESRMVLLQEKKANMINSTINADETAMESLTPEDMQFLFRGT